MSLLNPQNALIQHIQAQLQHQHPQTAPKSNAPLPVIIPPPDVKPLVEKTALYVAQNGYEFEKKVMDTKGNNPKFFFLKSENPYYGYYRKLVAEYIGQQSAEMPLEEVPLPPFQQQQLFQQPQQSQLFQQQLQQPQQPQLFQQQLQPAAAATLPAQQSLPPPPALPQPVQGELTSPQRELLSTTPIGKTEPAVAAPVVKGKVIKKRADVFSSRGKRSKPVADPIPYKFCVTVPRGMSPLDIDCIKLTAQYAAKHGQMFVNLIATREARNPQFDFLKPSHRFYPYFERLRAVYQLVLMPQPTDLQTLDFFAKPENRLKVLDRIYDKAEWESMEAEKKRVQTEQQQAENEAFNAIDWHDFAIVETIDFDEDEVIEMEHEVPVSPISPPPPPPALTQQQSVAAQAALMIQAITVPVPSLLLLQPPPLPPPSSSLQSSLPQIRADNVEMEDSITRPIINVEEIAKRLPVQPPATATAQQSQRPLSKPEKPTQEQMVKDPLTGQLIPLSQLQEHLRIQLIDPRYKEQKQKERQKFTTTNFASGEEVTQSLAEMVKKRGDIFGSSQDAQEEKPAEPRLLWDGHTASISRVQQTSKPTPVKKDEGDKITIDIAKIKAQAQAQAQAAAMAVVQQQQQPPPPIPPPPFSTFVPPPPPPSFVLPGMAPPQPPPVVGIAPPMGALPQGIPMGFVPPPLPFMDAPSQMVPPPPPPPSSSSSPPHSVLGYRPPPPPPADEEPSAKRQKSAEQNLIAEDLWMKRQPQRTISLRLKTPDNKDASMTGEVLLLESVDLLTTINDLKEIVKEKLGLPANKQRFILEGIGFLRDTQSLAYYNLLNGSLLTLAIKERSKKKK